MQEGLKSYINLFTNDAKLLKVVCGPDDWIQLQRDLDNLYEWSVTWKLEFNDQKCHVLEMGKGKRRPSWTYKMGEAVIAKRREEKDLGVLIQDNLQSEKQIKQIFDSMYRMLSNIRVAFHYMDKESMN